MTHSQGEFAHADAGTCGFNVNPNSGLYKPRLPSSNVTPPGFQPEATALLKPFFKSAPCFFIIEALSCARESLASQANTPRFQAVKAPVIIKTSAIKMRIGVTTIPLCLFVLNMASSFTANLLALKAPIEHLHFMAYFFFNFCQMSFWVFCVQIS